MTKKEKKLRKKGIRLIDELIEENEKNSFDYEKIKKLQWELKVVDYALDEELEK